MNLSYTKMNLAYAEKKFSIWLTLFIKEKLAVLTKRLDNLLHMVLTYDKQIAIT